MQANTRHPKGDPGRRICGHCRKVVSQSTAWRHERQYGIPGMEWVSETSSDSTLNSDLDSVPLTSKIGPVRKRGHWRMVSRESTASPLFSARTPERQVAGRNYATAFPALSATSDQASPLARITHAEQDAPSGVVLTSEDQDEDDYLPIKVHTPQMAKAEAQARGVKTLPRPCERFQLSSKAYNIWRARARFAVIGVVAEFTNTAGKTTPKELTWRTMPVTRRLTLLNAVKKVGKECVTVIHGGEQRDRYELDWAVEEMTVTILKNLRGSYPYDEYE